MVYTDLVVLRRPLACVRCRLQPPLVLRERKEVLALVALRDTNDRRDKLQQERRVQLEQRRVKVVEEVQDKTLDMRTIVILGISSAYTLATFLFAQAHLIRHDHQLAVPQARDVRVVLVVLQTQDLLDVLNLLVLHDLVVASFPDVEQLAAQGEDAVVVATDDTETSDGERLGGVSFGQDERAVLRILRAGVVGVGELGKTGKAANAC